jgi:multidrug efflux pump subunit AcrB
VAARGLTAGDVVDAIREQNVQVAAGVIGASPAKNSDFQLTVNTRAVCRRKKNSATSSCAPTPTARSRT